MFTTIEKSNIINTINSNKFTNWEYNQFYKIINNDTKLYSKNKNGIFVNSKNLSDSAYEQLQKSIKLFLQNKTKIDKLNENEKKKEISNNYSKLDYETSYDNLYYKLSNYEKNVIKKNKYFLNDSEEINKTSDELLSDDSDNITRYKT